MTPERMAELVAWVRLYTRDLPTPIAQRRVDEIGADLHDHIAHERANGISDRRIALGIASRMVRGLAADAAWRGHQAKVAARPSTREETMKVSKAVSRSAVRVAIGVALILSLPLVAMLITDEVVCWRTSLPPEPGGDRRRDRAGGEKGGEFTGDLHRRRRRPRGVFGRPTTPLASCSWASCSSSARVRSA